jgi:uncharacterized protein YcfL
MKNVTGILAILVLTGCNASDGTNINSIGNNTTPTTLAASQPTTPKATSPVVASPTPTSTATPITKYDPFDGKYGHRILIQDSSGTTVSTLDLYLPKLGSYSNTWGSNDENTFVYNRDVNTTSYVGCRSNWMALQDSDTNTHKLTIRNIEQTNTLTFVYGFYLMDVGAVDFRSWFYNATSECQDLYGEWNITIEPSDSTYNLMTRN